MAAVCRRGRRSYSPGYGTSDATSSTDSASCLHSMRHPHPARAHFLQEAGFSQLVLPRELTLDEIREMNSAVKVPLEAFVHGALCVSYSGDCQASYISIGRSANRGECAQICRYKFNLEDSTGNSISPGSTSFPFTTSAVLTLWKQCSMPVSDPLRLKEDSRTPIM